MQEGMYYLKTCVSGGHEKICVVGRHILQVCAETTI